MTEAELEILLDAIDEMNAEVGDDPDKARAYLISAGLLQTDGQLPPDLRIETSSE